jgi:PAS domain S-box-containing protein
MIGSMIDITERKRAEEALRQSREEFKNLFDNAPVGFHEVDAEGRLVRINNTELIMLGYSAEELSGQFVWKLSTDEEMSHRAMLAKLGGEPPPAQGYERKLRRKDGSVIPVLVNDRIVKREDGAIIGIHSTIQDITERKEAEAKLKENEAKFRALFEGSIYPIGLSKEGIQIMGNPAYAKLFGDSDVSATVGNSIFDDLVPEERPRVQEFARRRAMGDPVPAFYETRAIRRDGTVFDMAVGVSTYDLNGVVHSIRILRDITEHKRVEEAHARLAMAVEQAAETVVITDTHGTILYANPAFEKTSGYTRAEALGRNPRVLKSGRHDDEFYRRMWEVLGRGETWSGHFINKRKDGAFFEEEATISPVRDAAGIIVNFVAVKRNVTREVQLETQFRQAQKMEAIGQLAGGVAHDFNNILSVIQGYSDLLTNDGQLSPAQADYAVEIGTAVMRGAALSRQLLLFSRKEVLQPRDLDLNASINEMTKMLRRILGENIQLQFKFAMQDVFVHADAGMMDQVLLNLAVNARDAMPKGGQLVIETSAVDLDEAAAAQMPHARPGSFVCLSVSDTGCGISAEHLPRIFEPFFTTKDVGKGTGLGLATVFGIVQQHQGWIHVSSETGHGTMFRIYLPRLTGMSGQKAKQPGPSAARGGDETILLVEDDEALRASMRKILSRLGYCVLEAVNGDEALKIQEQYRDGIHLLLTDMMMPGGMTGKDLGERLLKENPKLKVIYASGYSAVVASGKFPLKAGVNFLTKPFQAQQLAQTVRQMLDENSETHSNASHDSAPAGRSCD